MAASGRQIEGATGETPVAELARAAIEQRLAAVTTSFPPAAEGVIDDHERVHRLRVSTRRAVAALELFRRFCPRRRRERVLKRLKQIRRAAGTARDLDVFTARLLRSPDDVHHDLLPDLIVRRHDAQRQITELYQCLFDDGSLAAHFAAVTKRLRPRGKKGKRIACRTVAQWAPTRLRKESRKLLRVVPENLDQPEELHPLRVNSKHLRYMLELLEAGVPGTTYDALYPLLEELQDRLGAINDHQTAMERLTTHHSAERQAAIENAVEQERMAMQQAIEQFQDWFCDHCLPQLRAVAEADHSDAPAGDTITASA